MPQMERSGAKVNYETWGEGQGAWVTLVNGHSRPLTDFRAMGRFLVDKGFRVAALDNRGAGKTIVTEPFRLEDFIDDVLALWNEVGAEQSHLLGISMGGMISQALAARFPGRVKSLVLVSTAPGNRWIEPVRDPNPEIDMLRYFSPRFQARNALFVKALAKETAKALRNLSDVGGPKGQRAAMKGFDATGELGKIKAPTLVVHGGADEVIRVEAAHEIARGIAGARVEIFDELGHLLLAEDPKRLYALVADFFARVEGLSGSARA